MISDQLHNNDIIDENESSCNVDGEINTSKIICSYRIMSSAFSKVLPMEKLNSNEHSLTSLQLNNNDISKDSNNFENTLFKTKIELIFEDIYRNVEMDFKDVKGSMESDDYFSHPMQPKLVNFNIDDKNFNSNYDKINEIRCSVIKVLSEQEKKEENENLKTLVSLNEVVSDILHCNEKKANMPNGNIASIQNSDITKNKIVDDNNVVQNGLNIYSNENIHSSEDIKSSKNDYSSSKISESDRQELTQPCNNDLPNLKIFKIKICDRFRDKNKKGKIVCDSFDLSTLCDPISKSKVLSIEQAGKNCSSYDKNNKVYDIDVQRFPKNSDKQAVVIKGRNPFTISINEEAPKESIDPTNYNSLVGELVRYF